jgi:HK97 family phage prohead protease
VSLTRVNVQCRAEINGNKLGGYASVFDQTTDLGWLGKERIARSAFDAVLADLSTDVRALFNHDASMLLGRQASGTLRLSVDSSGLEYEVDLPNTSVGRDVRELVERGDIDGASFGFVPGDYDYDENRGQVTHTSVRRLVDVSPVTFPAYLGASTEARSEDHLVVPQRSQLIKARARVLHLR